MSRRGERTDKSQIPPTIKERGEEWGNQFPPPRQQEEIDAATARAGDVHTDMEARTKEEAALDDEDSTAPPKSLLAQRVTNDNTSSPRSMKNGVHLCNVGDA